MSRPSHLFAVLATGVLLLGCTAEPTAVSSLQADGPHAAVVTNERTSFIDMDAISLCTGEVFPTTGTVHEVVSVTETATGVVRIVAHLQIHAVGTSPTGASLLIKTVATDVFPDVSFPPEGTTQIAASIIAKGSAPNEVNHLKYHLTLNANGTVTVTFDELTTRCQ